MLLSVVCQLIILGEKFEENKALEESDGDACLVIGSWMFARTMYDKLHQGKREGEKVKIAVELTILCRPWVIRAYTLDIWYKQYRSISPASLHAIWHICKIRIEAFGIP